MKDNKKIDCPICKNKSAIFFVKKNNCTLYRCEHCWSIFVWPISGSYLKIYQKDYFYGTANPHGYANYDGDKGILLENFKQYLDKIEKFSSKKGSLLDVGAATGNFIELANSHGWNAKGIELAGDAVEIGKNKYLDMIIGNFENYDFSREDYFDIITFWDVLEHFTDPDSVLRKAQRIVKPGGLIAINTPDATSFLAKILGKKWHLLVPPEHLNCLSSRGLMDLCKKNNFEIIYVGRIAKKFSLRYIFKILSNWNNFFLWKIIYGYLLNNRLGDVTVSLNTRDNIFVIARRVS